MGVVSMSSNATGKMRVQFIPINWSPMVLKSVLLGYSFTLTLHILNGMAVKTTFWKSWPVTLFQLLALTFDPFFNVK